MTERDYIQQDHRTQRARTIDKADRLVSDLETLETQLSAAIADAESIRDPSVRLDLARVAKILTSASG